MVRVENVEHPAQYIAAVLRRTQPKHIERTYDVKGYDDDPIEFLSLLARKGGRLLKGGEPDVDGVAKMVLNDFLRGKIPWFTRPPGMEEKEGGERLERGGRGELLGEMKRKRKADVLQDDDEGAAVETELQLKEVSRLAGTKHAPVPDTDNLSENNGSASAPPDVAGSDEEADKDSVDTTTDESALMVGALSDEIGVEDEDKGEDDEDDDAGGGGAELLEELEAISGAEED